MKNYWLVEYFPKAMEASWTQMPLIWNGCKRLSQDIENGKIHDILYMMITQQINENS